MLGCFLIMGVSSNNVKAQAAAPKKEAKALVCKVKISFGSPGTGIDGKVYDQIKALIAEKKLKHSEKRMGREGETEICLPLTELKKTKKADFIEQLKKIASSGQLVSVSTD